MPKKLNIKTSPHGEQKLTRTEPAGELTINNQLFTLKNSQGVGMGFTGEELSSLSNQWLKFSDSQK